MSVPPLPFRLLNVLTPSSRSAAPVFDIDRQRSLFFFFDPRRRASTRRAPNPQHPLKIPSHLPQIGPPLPEREQREGRSVLSGPPQDHVHTRRGTRVGRGVSWRTVSIAISPPG